MPSRSEAQAKTVYTLTDPKNVEQRNAYINRIDVLNKVGQLLLLDGLQMATARQIAAFYETELETIKTIYTRHKDELTADGMILYKGVQLDPFRCRAQHEHNKITGVSRKTRQALVFPKRAILRIGMLLRDSEIAKRIRTELLNIEEATEAPAKVAEINKEKELEMAVGQAFMSGDLAAFAAATAKVAEYKNRHIAKVEAQRDKLASKVTRFIEDENTMTLTDFAAYHVDGVSEAKLSRALQIIGVFGSRKKPIGEYKEEEWFKIIQKRGYDGVYRPQQVVTQKGVVEIVELIEAYEAKHGGNVLW
ncbi:hypothetical protein B5P41_18440 [Bacillus sp. SRB_28]|nr:hypothetical protein B5P41_18440 [Bacillus sp. SRB_28]